MNKSHSTKNQLSKILFVDDSHTEINYLKLLFEISDFPAEANFIVSAQEALDALRTVDLVDFPDIIIVDINMPLMDGFEFAESYRNEIQQRNPSTKIFIYSTSIHSKDVQRAKSTEGVTGFISKPFDQNAFEKYILPYIHPKKCHAAQSV